MTHVTYSLVPRPEKPDAIAYDVARLSSWVLSSGNALRDVFVDYRAFVDDCGRESPRSIEEYLVEGLLLGVLWRTRGPQALQAFEQEKDLIDELMAERRQSAPKRRDGSPARLLVGGGHPQIETLRPNLADLSQLMTWLLCTREYDDEVGRLAGWEEFLRHPQREGSLTLHRLVDFARAFEAESVRVLGPYTARVEGFLSREFANRPRREDTVQCSRPRVEYHFNIVGAELLNRAWREDFLRTDRQILVVPGCMRGGGTKGCGATRQGIELRCTQCDPFCPAGKATAAATREGVDSTIVLHGSDFGAILRAIAARGNSIGIVGVACVPGLVGAGWRAKELGLPAQCVSLESSGCGHWRSHPVPSRLDFSVLERMLGGGPLPRLGGGLRTHLTSPVVRPVAA